MPFGVPRERRLHSDRVPAIPDSSEIERAAAVLRAGGLVAFPTETVYGLGADASNPAAVAKIFAAKGRPQDHPVIVHLAGIELLPLWAGEIPAGAHQLAAAFWPGPLTLILKRAPGVPDCVTGGQDTVGLRIPGHPVALELLQVFAGEEGGRRFSGVAAPSANKFGRISPTTAEHVRAELGAAVDVVLDGGDCAVGIESTIVDLSRGRAVLLRPGQITPAQIAAVLGAEVDPPDAAAPRISGTLDSHYAPRTPLHLVSAAELPAKLAALRGKRFAVLARAAAPSRLKDVHWHTAPRAVEGYAHELYASLRRLDDLGCDAILVEAPPAAAEWQGVNDRLRRAASN
ncbi:MAG: threonylcarbamoyl-AMP synthase [Betaproteobacteria bacterium]|nr:MAG: threonylcarbamoyl-AMP synthase [Betaproteobacteria bacterium]